MDIIVSKPLLKLARQIVKDQNESVYRQQQKEEAKYRLSRAWADYRGLSQSLPKDDPRVRNAEIALKNAEADWRRLNS